MHLGAHVSIGGGFERAVREARELGCEAIQIFTGSRMQWRVRDVAPEAARRFARAIRQAGVGATLVHDSYLINLASPDPALAARSRAAFLAEIERSARLGIDALVFHPGAHMGAGEEAGLERVAAQLESILDEDRHRVTLLVENTAGQGTTLGHRLEHLAVLLDAVSRCPGRRRRLGVCIDTCHLFAAGYDLRTPRAYAATLGEIERVVGLDAVRALHLNDSKGGLGSRLDRHAEIGAGAIGARAFGRLVRDPCWAERPGILETPGGLEGYRRALCRLRRMRARARPPVRAPG
ncbi:MAG: deoxyribonuclease IV [Candidatus Eiseniibacteriota bacterium]|jgi:deoxyribonuclease-4